MPYKLITPPTSEPVTLVEAKQHLKVDFSDDDLLIGAMITAAREYAEMKTQRQLVTAQWKLVLDSFPGPSLIGVPFGVPYSLPGHAILINKTPLLTVDAITYLDMSSTRQTMPPADYAVESTSEPARVTPVFGKIWPIPLPQIGAVEVDFTSGYGAPDAQGNWTPGTVPEGIKRWILLRVGALYENREEISVGQRIVVNELPFVDRLLDPYTVLVY